MVATRLDKPSLKINRVMMRSLLALALSLLFLPVPSRTIAADADAAKIESWQKEGEVTVDEAKKHSASAGAFRLAPGAKMTLPLRAEAGSGRVSMWVFDDGVLPPDGALKERHVGPRWGVTQPDGRALAGAVMFAPYLGGEADEDQIGRNEDFNRIAMLASTLTREELLGLEPEKILHRLFWEEQVRTFEPLATSFACSCSRERVQAMLQGLGQAEIESILDERETVEVGCEFCGQQFRFDAVQAAQMFTPDRDQPPAPDTLQ